MMKPIKALEDELLNCKWKKILRIVGVIVAAIVLVFLLEFCYRMIWTKWSTNKYQVYKSGMEELHKNDLYCKSDGDYLFTVKYPEYPTLEGNLVIGRKDDAAGLTIWPKLFGGYKYGLQLKEDEVVYNIEIKNGIVDKDYQDLVDQYKDEITILMKKVKEEWKIQLEEFK